MNEQKRLTPIKAIRAKYLECSCGDVKEVRECVIPKCPLYPYRMGRNPFITLSDEERARRAQKCANLTRKHDEKTLNASDEGNYRVEEMREKVPSYVGEKMQRDGNE